MAAGDVVKTFRFRKETIASKTNTTVTKGDLLAYDTDGFAPATQTILKADRATPFKKFVATATVAAVVDTQNALDVLAEGVIGISKVSGALDKGQLVGATATAGKVGAWAPPLVSGSGGGTGGVYCAVTLQAQLDTLLYVVGEVQSDAANSDAFVNTVLG